MRYLISIPILSLFAYYVATEAATFLTAAALGIHRLLGGL